MTTLVSAFGMHAGLAQPCLAHKDSLALLPASCPDSLVLAVHNPQHTFQSFVRGLQILLFYFGDLRAGSRQERPQVHPDAGIGAPTAPLNTESRSTVQLLAPPPAHTQAAATRCYLSTPHPGNALGSRLPSHRLQYLPLIDAAIGSTPIGWQLDDCTPPSPGSCHRMRAAFQAGLSAQTQSCSSNCPRSNPCLAPRRTSSRLTCRALHTCGAAPRVRAAHTGRRGGDWGTQHTQNRRGWGGGRQFCLGTWQGAVCSTASCQPPTDSGMPASLAVAGVLPEPPPRLPCCGFGAVAVWQRSHQAAAGGAA